jgi:hypothetical protein
VLYGPQDSCQTIRTVRKYTQKYITAVTSISVPTNVVWQPWNACQYSQKLQLLSSSISVHIKCCTTSTNPYGTACSSLLSEIRTSLCLGMCALLQQMLSLFSARPLSCSLLFSQQECLTPLVLSTRMLQLPCSWHLTKNLLASHQESLALSTRLLLLLLPLLLASASWHLTKISPTTQEWVRPLAQVDLMREGEEFSNLTVEIRLDGWLRFGVSSLTLTLIIKSPFNLHLTN